MIELLAGGGVAIVAGFVGAIMGYSRGVAQKNITSLFITGQQVDLWCTCDHATSFHEDGTGKCHELMYDVKGRIVTDQFGQARKCRCQTFVGDKARNPDPIYTRGELEL